MRCSMRTLKRNKQKLYYALYLGKQKLYDDNGDIVGEGEVYSFPVEFEANISPNKGESSAEPFGASLNYSRTLCTNEKLPLDEHSLIWYETEPEFAESDGDTADYTIVAIANSINSTLYALRKRVKDGLSEDW